MITGACSSSAWGIKVSNSIGPSTALMPTAPKASANFTKSGLQPGSELDIQGAAHSTAGGDDFARHRH